MTLLIEKASSGYGDQRPPIDLSFIERAEGIDRLTTMEIPVLLPDQMKLITKEAIMERQVERFDPDEAIKALEQNEGKRILTIDMGGDTVKEVPWVIKDGRLVVDLQRGVATVKKEGKGANYMPFFEEVARQSKVDGLGVAISYGGPLEGTSPMDIPNATDFRDALRARYGGDFAVLFPDLRAVNNDAQAGIKTAAIVARRTLMQDGRLKRDGSIMFAINGGGFGFAYLMSNELRATELGHSRLIDPLNPYGQTIPCDVLGRTYVCLEKVAASGAGVETLWRKITGELLDDGKAISHKYQEGDPLAREIYEYSARVFAHGLVAVADLDNLMQSPRDTVLVFHGGGYRVPGLKERILQIIGRERGFQPPTMFTDDISFNACAEGAAIAGFYNSSPQTP